MNIDGEPMRDDQDLLRGTRIEWYQVEPPRNDPDPQGLQGTPWPSVGPEEERASRRTWRSPPERLR